MSEKSIEDIEGLASIESNIWACIYRAHEFFPDVPERMISKNTFESTVTGDYNTPGNPNVTPGGPS
jgi:hypothetical protein